MVSKHKYHSMKTIHTRGTQHPTLSEATIIQRILTGEKELYEILMRRNNQKLYRVLRGYFTDTREIEDLMQNTYLKAYEKLSYFRQDALFSTWLIRIGINEALARLRAKRKTLPLAGHTEPPAVTPVIELPDHHRPNPEQAILMQEARQLLEKAIDELTPTYRTVYILREVEQMPIREIAACLDLNPTNVKVRLHRARKMIKEELYRYASLPEVFTFGFTRCDRLVERVLRKLSK